MGVLEVDGAVEGHHELDAVGGAERRETPGVP